MDCANHVTLYGLRRRRDISEMKVSVHRCHIQTFGGVRVRQLDLTV